MISWIKKSIFSSEPSIEPDYPCPFGYKTLWYAVKNETPHSVIEKFKLNILCWANWKSGVPVAYETSITSPVNKKIFVSPCLDGYVLIIGIHPLTHGNDEIVKSHALLFDELQFFASHRVVDYYCWAKFQNHNLVRAYAYVGDVNEISWNEGTITAEELVLGFDRFPATETELGEEDVVFPNEEDVLYIAKAWGIDPKFENRSYEKSTGYLCKR